MRIKKQISLLIITLLVLHLTCIILFPMFYYMQTSDSDLMKKYRDERQRNPSVLSEKSWNQIQKFIESKPHDLEVLVIHHGKVTFSSFPDIPRGMEVTFNSFYPYMKNTLCDYDYQIQSFYKSNDEIFITKEAKINMDRDYMNNSGLIISRRNINSHSINKSLRLKGMVPFYLVIVVMELVFIVFAFFIIRIISNSVIRLKQATENIISGDIGTPVDTFLNKSEADEISSLAENLEKMRINLKENIETKSRFIMGISHDLRTPVALIKGYSEAIEDGVICGDSLCKSACLINQNAVRLEEMINDLINYVKLNNTDWKQNLTSIALKPQLESYLCNMRCAADIYRRKVTGNFNIPENLTVKMDANLFQRVIENLFTNALRYTRDGDEISLKAYLNSNNTPVVIFRDTGPGIDKKDQQKVFELFFRGTNSRREDGMGIGLAVVKTIIESHGWNIEINSELNKGTEFIITLN
ncbi:HAMP domain-containing sensor histidine kinase [Treponema sp.]|uniref:HAMP domain-containing sensor histidine kinase n=1 Tax=Treponema sp. TaxID=166 RepID=UPI002A83F804|nr:HAMP domain-containing sensor histidine kinase [Treponema sp.]MCI6441411.1 HAMP domain-containing histidine kinase [Spirochaetia bacterium]MDY4131789.1 HAMP domain-containing sensor histidine kinase [Treponema sp.]